MQLPKIASNHYALYCHCYYDLRRMGLWLGLHPTKRCDLEKSFNQSTQNYPPITISNLKTQTLELAIVKDVTIDSIVALPSIRNRPLVPRSELVSEGHRFYFFTSTLVFFYYNFFFNYYQETTTLYKKAEATTNMTFQNYWELQEFYTTTNAPAVFQCFQRKASSFNGVPRNHWHKHTRAAS